MANSSLMLGKVFRDSTGVEWRVASIEPGIKPWCWLVRTTNREVQARMSCDAVRAYLGGTA